MINIKIDGQHSHVKVENVRNPEQLLKELICVVTSASTVLARSMDADDKIFECMDALVQAAKDNVKGTICI